MSDQARLNIRRIVAAAALVIVCSLTGHAAAQAQTEQEFFKGKQIRFIVGSTTGNDNDLWARLLGRHLPRHIPGNPTIVVENMPGAGQVIATNYLFNAAPHDGTVIGMVSRSMPSAALMNVPNVRFDPVKFNWLGSPEVSSLVMYVNTSTSVRTVSDLYTRELIVGGTGPGQGITVGPMLLKHLLKMNIKIVTGYRAPGDLALAAARGEIEAFANTVPASGAKRPWVESGQMHVLFNYEPEPVPGLGAPSIFDFIKTDEHRKVMTFFASNVLLGRPLVAPPATSPARVEVLRRALDATMQDAALLKEAGAMTLEVTPQTGEKIAELVASVAHTAPEIVQQAERAARGE